MRKVSGELQPSLQAQFTMKYNTAMQLYIYIHYTIKGYNAMQLKIQITITILYFEIKPG